jgi:hypothetical protein
MHKARSLVAVTLTGAALAAGMTLAKPASADTVVCSKFGNTRNAAGYIVQINVWGTDAAQCVNVTSTGFRITTFDASKPTNGAPASYPSMLWGCHYNSCTNGFDPVRTSSSAFSSIRTRVDYTFTNRGAWNASYDLWFDPTPRRDGQNTGAELMIWLNRQGGVQPIGRRVATATVAGATWDVWFGNIGWNVISYVRTTPSTTLDTTVDAFYGDVVSRGYGERSWYLTSIQAGFEPWRDGTGLAVNDFSVTS